jgi:ABC-type Zn uptake system ZnuABC Zn-binding protein ZnuA
LDPELAHIYPETVADSLSIIDGGRRSFYYGNYTQYVRQLK